MPRIYHITSADEASRASAAGTYTPQAFGDEGFIHCSYGHQLNRVANLRFRDRQDLVLLEIDTLKLNCAVIDENLEGGRDLFPHIYGPLPMRAVVEIHPFPCNDSGRFDFEENA